jgi:hypothetical protein
LRIIPKEKKGDQHDKNKRPNFGTIEDIDGNIYEAYEI